MFSLIGLVFVIDIVIRSLFTTSYAYCGSEEAVCGGITFAYPFSVRGNFYRGDCGHPRLSIDCANGKPVIDISNSHYVLDLYNKAQTLRVVAKDVYEQECPRPSSNWTIGSGPYSYPFGYSPGYRYDRVIYYYNCSTYPENVVQHLPCLHTNNNHSTFAFWGDENQNSIKWLMNCKKNVVVEIVNRSQVPSYNHSDYIGMLKYGFFAYWLTPSECQDCEDSGGQCWLNQTARIRPFCYCQDGQNATIFDKICPKQGATTSSLLPPKGAPSTSQFAPKEAPSTPQLPPKEAPSPSQFPSKGATNTTTRNNQIGIPTKLKIILGVCSGAGGIVLVILFIYRRKLSSIYTSIVSHWKSKIKSRTNVEAFLESCGCLGLQRYTYSEIKKITNSFKETLGQGGFGSVFRGKLPSGRLVAVKVLNESKGNGEDFINEVATIGWTNHVNVVRLLGFCSSGNKQALVYEFMVNGSLEKFIYNQKIASITNPTLGWEKLYQIALGIAKGLEYLHCGCNTRILHFDIKPHNILLDQDFCPKISDFGLAKLCQTKQSIVSMQVARGTIGYIAPEVYCRNFGGVSSKSDVYSYGMMIFEMIGGRKNIDATVQNTSEIYFPQWIYNHLKQDISIDGSEELYTEEATRKMIIVGLWCIQTQPSDRPSISKVVEMLEGSVDELQIPPNPFQGSPSGSFL